MPRADVGPRRPAVVLVVQVARPRAGSRLAVLGWRGGGDDAARGGRRPARPPATTVDRFDARPGVRARARAGRASARGRRARRGAAHGSPCGCAGGCPSGPLEAVPGAPACGNVVGTLPGAAPGDRRRRALRHEGHARGLRRAPTTAPAGPRWSSSSRARCAARRARRTPREVRFVLFDGEEAPARLRRLPARRAARLARLRARARASELEALVLLDFVADRGLRLPREGSSDAALWARLRAAAARGRASARVVPGRHGRPSSTTTRRSCDAGVPAIDLIDFAYPRAHAAGHARQDLAAQPRRGRRGGAAPRAELALERRARAAGAPTLGPWPSRSREAPARRAARLLRRRRPRRADRRARARALRRAGLRAQGDRPQQARGRAAARARRGLRRRARRRDPRGRDHRLLRPRRLARPSTPTPSAARLQTIDATCPLVTKVHREALKFAAEGYTIVLIGHAGHEEVEGTMGEAPDAHRARRDRGRRRRARGRGPRRSSPTSRRPRCRSTRRARSSPACASASRTSPGRAPTTSVTRRRTARRPSSRWRAQCDLVLVIGSRNSSNSNRLVEVAREHGADSHLIDNEAQVRGGVARGRARRRHHLRRERARGARPAPRRLLPRARHRRTSRSSRSSRRTSASCSRRRSARPIAAAAG